MRDAISRAAMKPARASAASSASSISGWMMATPRAATPLARHHPGRLMWASSLPQADGDLHGGHAWRDLDAIASALELLPGAEDRARVFAANAERFYGF